MCSKTPVDPNDKIDSDVEENVAEIGFIKNLMR